MRRVWGAFGLVVALLMGSFVLPQRAYAASIGVVSVTVRVRPPIEKPAKPRSFMTNQRFQHLTYRALLRSYPLALMSRYV